MRPATKRLAAALAALAAAAACEGTGPKAGTIGVSLTGPVPARAAQFRLVGPHSTISAGGANVRVFSTPLGGDTVMVVAVANAGHALSESDIATVTVPDVDKAAGYTLTLIQVASATYALQNVAQYAVTIAP